jgi:hypothetical protein
MKNTFKILIIVISIQLLFSCDAEDNILTYDSEIVSIEYGTSFGQCIGYCSRNIEITGTDIIFNASGQTVTGKLPEIVITDVISIEDWEELVNTIDVLIFRNMEEVIGCPDCADGGAEWIEITTDELNHKIVFEYNNEPEELETYIEELRELLEQFEDKLK